MSKVRPLLLHQFQELEHMLGLSPRQWPATDKEVLSIEEQQQFDTGIACVADALLKLIFQREVYRRCRVCKSAKNYANSDGVIAGLTYDLDPKPKWNGFELYQRCILTGKDLPILCTHCEAVTLKEANRVQNAYGGHTIMDVPEYIRKEVRSELNRRKGKSSRDKVRTKISMSNQPNQISLSPASTQTTSEPVNSEVV